jgi:hypothetical protein
MAAILYDFIERYPSLVGERALNQKRRDALAEIDRGNALDVAARCALAHQGNLPDKDAEEYEGQKVVRDCQIQIDCRPFDPFR